MRVAVFSNFVRVRYFHADWCKCVTEYSSDVKLGVEGGSNTARQRGGGEISAHNTQTFVFPLEADNSACTGPEDDSREVGEKKTATFSNIPEKK